MPRPHHYEFAHRALPQIAFAHGERFLSDLAANPGAVGFARAIEAQLG